MNPSDEAAAEKAIRDYIWSGFYKADEIQSFITEEIYPSGQIDSAWSERKIASESEKKRLDERTWKSPTDPERLTAAFDELGGRNVIALQNAGYTSSEGIDAITEIWIDKGAEKSPIDGYCFFHYQDLVRALAGEGLMLCFGDILGTDTKGLLVGKTIVDVLNRHGFPTEWDGSINTRINIEKIQWQKREPQAVSRRGWLSRFFR